MTAVFWFDLRQRLSRLGFLAYFVLFTATSCFLFMAAAGAFPSVNIGLSSGGKVLTNSPYMLHNLTMTYCVFSVMLTAAAMGQAIYQDYDHQMASLFFVTPLRRRQYLFGRYLSALVYLIILFSSFGLGFFLGSILPGTEARLVGPDRFAAFAMPYFVGVIPNQIIAGSLFFALAARTRKMIGVYTGSVVLLAVYLIAGSVDVDVEYKWLAGLIDPFGTFASQFMSEYWSIAEKNSRLLGWEGMLLYNRVLWLTWSLVATVALLWNLRLGHPEETGAVDLDRERAPTGLPLPVVPLDQRRPSSLPILGATAWLLFRDSVRNIYFLVMALSAIAIFVSTARTAGSLYGTITYPVTYLVAEMVGNSFGLFMLIIIIFSSGELVWRERDSKVDQIIDSLPTADWVVPVARLIALAGVLFVMALLMTTCGFTMQIVKGYFRFEPTIYVVELFVFSLSSQLVVAVLALFFHALVRSKTTGHVLMILFYASKVLMVRLDLEHPLYQYGGQYYNAYSDMNRWGHLLTPTLLFSLYWAFIAGVLMVAVVLVGVRGREDSWRLRLRGARQRLTWSVFGAVVVLLAGALGLGGFLFYNTNRLNRFRDSVAERHLSADYERQYKSLATLPQPSVRTVDVTWDLSPTERTLGIELRYGLENANPLPVTEVLISIDSTAKIDRLEVAGIGPSYRDPIIGFYRIVLATPLAPGDKTELHFAGRFVNPGFPGNGPNNRIVANGSFIDSGSLPQIGYLDEAELRSDDSRRREHLPTKERMPDLDDADGRSHHYLATHADWVTVHSIIHTDADQIALAPGSLVADKTVGARRTFEYRTDAPVLPFFSMLSARYAVERAQWRDVAIEIYYHPTHTYNVARMVEGVKDTLDYLTTTIGPYPHKQVRIVEFPRYSTYAQSFPTTIPFAESIGFIAKVDSKNDKDVDYPYYVTAHEVAHQWWANQVIGAEVQGATLLSESLSQYTALMVMKRKLGANQMKKFLRYELDRYLMGRSFESKKELPIVRVENQQYIHYQKGTLVTYALANYIGEDVFNRGLRLFFERFRFKAAPYPTSRDLLAALREVMPPGQQSLLVDWFEQITLYSLRCDDATAKKRDDGKWDVTVEVAVEKTRATALGDELPWPITEEFDIGVLDADGRIIALTKHAIPTGTATFTLTVGEKPARAGIDPLFKLIDRLPDDNTRPVKSKR